MFHVLLCCYYICLCCSSCINLCNFYLLQVVARGSALGVNSIVLIVFVYVYCMFFIQNARSCATRSVLHLCQLHVDCLQNMPDISQTPWQRHRLMTKMCLSPTLNCSMKDGCKPQSIIIIPLNNQLTQIWYKVGKKKENSYFNMRFT